MTNPAFEVHSPNSTFTLCIPSENITEEFTTIRDICKSRQTGLISSMRFEEKLGHTNLNPERIYLYIMGLIQNDWKHILRNKTSQKSHIKTILLQ